MAKHGKELSDDTKRNIIQLIESGHRASHVAKSLQISKSTISRLLKRWRIRGDIENLPRTGRKKTVTKRAENALSRVVKSNRRLSLKDITSEFNGRVPAPVSRRTVQRNLHNLGYTRRSVRKKIGIREVNKKKRVAYCREKLLWTVETNWKKVIFSDEMMIVLKPDGCLKVWRRSCEVWRPECLGYVAVTPSTTIKLMVWGSLTYYGVGTLVTVNGNMNSEKYIETLDDNLWQVVAKNFGNNPYIFQDDNAPCHRSRAVEEWKRQNEIPGLIWPPQSPDLSPIENIWLLMKNKIKNRLHVIRSKTDLEDELKRIWMETPLVYVRGLYASLPRRVRQVLVQKGDITKY